MEDIHGVRTKTLKKEPYATLFGSGTSVDNVFNTTYSSLVVKLILGTKAVMISYDEICNSRSIRPVSISSALTWRSL